MVQPTAAAGSANDRPQTYSEHNVVLHPSLRKDGIDVENYLGQRPGYTNQYLESVRPVTRVPTRFHETLGLAWHSFASMIVYFITFSWLSFWGPQVEAFTLMLRMLTFAGVGLAGSAAGATYHHFRSVGKNTSDNGWAHVAISKAENCRYHGGCVSQAVRLPFVARLLALFLQAVLYLQVLAVTAIAPSVAMAYDMYRAEEQISIVDRLLDLMKTGTRMPWGDAPAPEMARSYYFLDKTASMRDVLLRIRADEACNEHLAFVLGSAPVIGGSNPFLVASQAT